MDSDLEERVNELELRIESLEIKLSLGALFMIKDFTKETVRKTAHNILQDPNLCQAIDPCDCTKCSDAE